MCRPLSQGGRRCPGKGGEYRRAQARKRYHERKVRDEFAGRFGSAGTVERVHVPKSVAEIANLYGESAARLRDELTAAVPALRDNAARAKDALDAVPRAKMGSAGDESEVRSKLYASATRLNKAVSKYGDDSPEAERARANYAKWNDEVERVMGNTPERIAAEREYVKAAEELGEAVEASLIAAVLAESQSPVPASARTHYATLGDDDFRAYVIEHFSDIAREYNAGRLRTYNGEEIHAVNPEDVDETAVAVAKMLTTYRDRDPGHLLHIDLDRAGLTPRERELVGDTPSLVNAAGRYLIDEGFDKHMESVVGRDNQIQAWSDQMGRLGMTPMEDGTITVMSQDNDAVEKRMEETVKNVSHIFPAEALDRVDGLITFDMLDDPMDRAHMAPETVISGSDWRDRRGKSEPVVQFVNMKNLSTGALRRELKRDNDIAELRKRERAAKESGDWLAAMEAGGDAYDLERRHLDGVEFTGAVGRALIDTDDKDSVRWALENPAGRFGNLRESSLPATEENVRLMREYGKRTMWKTVEFNDHNGDRRIAFGNSTDEDPKFLDSWEGSPVAPGADHRIRLSPIDGEATLAHEIGHIFEYNSAEMSAATRRYIHDTGYGATYEVYCSSKKHGRELVSTSTEFATPYVSKIYVGTPATEVISVGMEHVQSMFTTPGGVLGFAASEREREAGGKPVGRGRAASAESAQLRRLTLGLLTDFALSGSRQMERNNENYV